MCVCFYICSALLSLSRPPDVLFVLIVCVLFVFKCLWIVVVIIMISCHVCFAGPSASATGAGSTCRAPRRRSEGPRARSRGGGWRRAAAPASRRSARPPLRAIISDMFIVARNIIMITPIIIIITMIVPIAISIIINCISSIRLPPSRPCLTLSLRETGFWKSQLQKMAIAVKSQSRRVGSDVAKSSRQTCLTLAT